MTISRKPQSLGTSRTKRARPVNDDPLARIITQLESPEQWSELPDPDLSQLLVNACMLFALHAPRWQDELSELYEEACQRLSSDARLAALLEVGALVERLHRAAPPVNAVGLTSALAPFVEIDDDPVVVSSASLQLSALVSGDGRDALAGPRHVAALVVNESDEARRLALFTGLVATGDRRVLDLLDGRWADLLPRSVRPQAIANLAHVTAFDVLLKWFTAAGADADDVVLGVLVPALERLGRTAQTAGGLTELERTFPVTATSEPPVRIVRTWSVDALRPQVQQHVAPLAHNERYPRIIPTALRAWGIEDAAYLDSLAAAVPDEADLVASLVNPVRLDVVPDWDRPDALIEWCVFNPFGPTRKQVLCTALPDGRGRALVLTQHHFLEPFALLVATLPVHATDEEVRRLLHALFSRNGALGQAVCGPLPTIVDLRAGAVCDVAFAAQLFREAQRSARDEGCHGFGTLDEAIDHSRRTGDDPWRAALEEFRTAQKDSSAGNLPRVEDDSTEPLARYVTWCEAASAPRRVANVRGEFVKAWAAAVRSYNGGQFAVEAGDARA